MEPPIRVIVLGAAGRMGRESVRALAEDSTFQVVGAVDRHHTGAAVLEAPDDLRYVATLDEVLAETQADVTLDFSHASVAVAHAAAIVRRGGRFVIGCTGLSAAQFDELQGIAQDSGGMVVPNFAIGAVLMMRFAQLAARWLPDAEIIELHHDRKEDAPSGTAMRTAELIDEARTQTPAEKPRPLLKVEGARGADYRRTPIHSVRLPGLLAHQEVIFGGMGEVLTLRHDSLDRRGFMPGVRLALREVKNVTGLVVGLDGLLFGERYAS
jgi:4-hydroxy-tetrahydrodipicolinate reductase